MQIQDAINEYLVAARQEGKSAKTIEQYGWHLERMKEWLATEGVNELEGVDRSTLRRWGAGLTEKWSASTIRQAVYAARALFGWCREEGWIADDPSLALRAPHAKKRIQRTLSPDEIQAILDACDNSASGRRNAALVSLLVDAGLRASEICRLRIADLDIGEGLLVVKVKGGDERFGFFGRTTGDRLQTWLDVRPNARHPEVFLSVGGLKPGSPLTVPGLRSILRKLGERAGVARVSTHAFRRSFACVSTKAGAPGRIVQLAGRWSNIQMVEDYTRAMREIEAGLEYRERYSSADWIEKNRS